MSRSEDEVPPFGPLADYVPPSGPVTRLAQRLLQRVGRVLSRGDDPVVEDDLLKQASRATIDGYTASPDCSLLARELDATLGDWADDEGGSGDTLRLIVIPPGDGNALLETWAARHGHAVLRPPAFGALVRGGAHERGGDERGARVTSADAEAADGDDEADRDVPFPLEGRGVLVVPRLERWFVRHRHGLAAVRALLAALSDSERRCVIGCNSWAWLYLRRAAEADLLLPEPLTFAPFDAERLRHWFKELSEEEGTRDVVFRESSSGADVFSRGEDGEFESGFLPGLAARSRGIPWVAWQLWQRSLRTRRVDKDGASEDEHRVNDEGRATEEALESESTMWLVEADEYVLPVGHERTARLVLHALLLHGRLGVDELARVLPIVGESSVVPALVRAGLVERAEGRYRCASSAYPAIRESLVTAGLEAPVA